MQLNRALVFLCLVIVVVSGAQRDHRVTCYLDVLTPRTNNGLCTHIVVPSAWTNEGFDIQSLSECESYTFEMMKRRRNPTQKKILLGLEVDEPRLALMFSNENSVENFIHTSVRYLKEKRFDGLDLTWVNGPISDESRNNYTSFLEKLRGAFEEEARSSSDPTLLLSVSLCLCGFDMQELSKVVDFISVLPVQLEKDGVNINRTVQQWQDQQVDLKKLNLAMPAFLQRSHRKHHHKSSTSNDETDPDEGKKYHIRAMGLNLANQVCQAVKSREQFMTLTTISYEASLVEQVSWLLQKGFGGVAVVFIDMDVFCNSVCEGITEDEMVMVELKKIAHPERRGDIAADPHFCHSHGHDHQHENHSQESHDIGDPHRHRHHHRRHGHHGHHRRGHHHHHHHHHHPHQSPQYNTSTEQQPGLE
nr:histidine-rich carboxyl terminus protein 1 [Misgurnus anguillicaudatus]XP_055044594.1 histidine-rich carboxyl terminus protein 1 [Misgurnus anguillicaudatus]